MFGSHHNLTPSQPPCDPELERLLDEALAPGDMPPDLVARILARTQDRLPGRRHVLARIGPYLLSRGIAAAVIVSATAGLIGTATLIVRDARDLVAVRSGLDSLESLALSTPAAIDRVADPVETTPTALPAIDTRQLGQEFLDAQNTLDEALSDFERSRNEAFGPPMSL